MQTKITTMDELGWEKYAEDLPQILAINPEEIARVTIENKSVFTLQSAQGELEGFLRGRALYQNEISADRPKVGDWVRIEKLQNEKRAIIKEILPRKSKIARKEKMNSVNEQVLVTNIDTAFVVQGLDGDFNVRRLERYISIIKEGHAKAIIVLNKIDLVKNLTEYIDKVRAAISDVEILTISAENGTGFDELLTHILPKETVVFIGSSGAGKSTILNRFLNKEIQKTQTVREDDSRGKHTTTRRELFILPNGGIIIDTPGMREVGIGTVESIDTAFSDIRNLMTQCKFTKCDHEKTMGCAVKSAIENGELDEKRYQNFLKLEAELERENLKKSISYQKERKHKNKVVSKTIRKVKKHNNKYLDF